VSMNAPTDSTGSSSRIIPSCTTYASMLPYKRYLNELFDEITHVDVLPYFMETHVKLNGARINEEDLAIFDYDVTKGLAD
ncbi:hypothetical protein MKX01_010798, partial [Papaver californicum]